MNKVVTKDTGASKGVWRGGGVYGGWVPSGSVKSVILWFCDFVILWFCAPTGTPWKIPEFALNVKV